MGQLLDIFGANKARKAQEKAADKSIAASTQATDKSLSLQKEMFDKLWGGTQVQRDAGDAATRMMASLMGLSMPASQGAQSQSAVSQAYPAGQSGASVSYGAAPQNALQMRMAETGGEPGIGYDQPMNALSGAQYGQADLIQNNQPVAQSGGVPANALSGAQSPTDWLRSTPGYQFNLDEGMRALNTGLASQGRLFSGDAGREAVRYGQNYGDRIYGDQWNRLAGIAGAGQTAQSQGQQAGQNYTNNSQNALMWNAGNVSSSYRDQANATSGFWGDMTGKFGGDAIARYAGQALKGGF